MTEHIFEVSRSIAAQLLRESVMERDRVLGHWEWKSPQTNAASRENAYSQFVGMNNVPVSAKRLADLLVIAFASDMNMGGTLKFQFNSPLMVSSKSGSHPVHSMSVGHDTILLNGKSEEGKSIMIRHPGPPEASPSLCRDALFWVDLSHLLRVEPVAMEQSVHG